MACYCTLRARRAAVKLPLRLGLQQQSFVCLRNLVSDVTEELRLDGFLYGAADGIISTSERVVTGKYMTDP